MPPSFPPHRPPWYPADEPWPPANHWRRMRGRFFWRIGALVMALFLFTCLACPLAFYALASATRAAPDWLSGPGAEWRRFGPPVGLLVGAAGVALTVWALRRVTAPMGDVMEAAGRVAAGDYTVRVAERGPAEARALARAFNTMTTRLQTSDEQRRRLLADVTHELRTPLAVVQGNLEGLLDGIYPRDDAHLAPILDETRVLARLIEDLRTLSLAESGALRLQREPTDLEVLAEEAAAAYRARAEAAGVALRVESAGDLPLVEVDPVRVREVLANLIANGLRYTPAGGALTVTAAAGEAGQVVITVHDTGAGIPPEVLPRLFDRFYKSDESRGTGLGLAIAKSLVDAHGGALTVESAPGQGTTFRLTLPAA